MLIVILGGTQSDSLSTWSASAQGAPNQLGRDGARRVLARRGWVSTTWTPRPLYPRINSEHLDCQRFNGLLNMELCNLLICGL
jgi:hypothetical protein